MLSIGHAYVIALNRATMRVLAADPGFEVVLAAARELDVGVFACGMAAP